MTSPDAGPVGPVVVAVDSFTGSIAAAAAAAAIAEGWRSARPDAELRLLPVADDGEGTLDAFAASVPGARRMPVTVTGPDDHDVVASWLLLPPTTDAPRGSGASTDGGVGMLSALGARFLDADGRPVARGGAGSRS